MRGLSFGFMNRRVVMFLHRGSPLIFSKAPLSTAHAFERGATFFSDSISPALAVLRLAPPSSFFPYYFQRPVIAFAYRKLRRPGCKRANGQVHKLLVTFPLKQENALSVVVAEASGKTEMTDESKRVRRVDRTTTGRNWRGSARYRISPSKSIAFDKLCACEVR
jgi:hypothetical protein